MELTKRVKVKKKFRVDCIGGCGTQVLRDQGECRKCRRKRRQTGAKIISRAKRSNIPMATRKPWNKKTGQK